MRLLKVASLQSLGAAAQVDTGDAHARQVLDNWPIRADVVDSVVAMLYTGYPGRQIKQQMHVKDPAYRAFYIVRQQGRNISKPLSFQIRIKYILI